VTALLRLLAFLSVLIAGPVMAQSFPPFTGLVVDNANVLTPGVEQSLTTKLEALQASTHRQMVVATIGDLQGDAIEDYGYRLGRTWGVGLRDVDNGIILIVAPNERKVRIEVGYGLTPIVTDALSSVIIQTAILPKFREGDLPGGIVAGTDALIAQLAAPDEEAKRKAEAALAAQQREQESDWFPLIFWGIVLLVILIVLFRSRGGGRSFRSGSGPIVIWGGDSGGWSSGSSGGGWSSGGGFSGGGGGSFGGGGASGSW